MYVYTMDAARSRLRRGAKEVKVFLPYSGGLMKVTKKNWKQSIKTFRFWVKSGGGKEH